MPDHAPYHPEIGKGITKAIEQCDIALLDTYLREMCAEMAIILKRQRGDAYGLGDSEHPDALVTNMVTDE